jgi:nucleotide-binding universal stress UspA family protein
MLQSSELGQLEQKIIAGSSILDRVFVPVDYSMPSHLSVGVALELRRAHGSKVCLFHAVESDGTDEWLGGIGSDATRGDWATAGRQRLERFLEHVAPGIGAGIDLRVRVGSIRETLRQEARSWGATLIVATADAHTGLFRSPAERLVRDARVPILVIPTHPI